MILKVNGGPFFEVQLGPNLSVRSFNFEADAVAHDVSYAVVA